MSMYYHQVIHSLELESDVSVKILSINAISVIWIAQIID